MIKINGASGEGGGQIVRTSLALSLITKQAFEIIDIRANRSPSGLRAQHLAAVRLAARISAADTTGAELHSSRFVFEPQDLRPGQYKSGIETAGSASLVLQTAAIPLALQAKKSIVSLTGGTHVPFSPSYEFLLHTWQNLLARIGIRLKIELLRAGYFPRGGGEIRCQVFPASGINPLELTERGKLEKIWGYSGVSNLDIDIARRMKHQLLRRIEPVRTDVKITLSEHPSMGTGAWCCIIAEFENVKQTFTSLGEKGKRAELVADETADALLGYLKLPGVVDQYTADQLLLPLALANGASSYTTTSVSTHLLTNSQVIQEFLDCKVEVLGELNQPGAVHVYPATE